MAQDQVLHRERANPGRHRRDRKTGAARALLAKLERGTLTYAGPAFIALQREDRDAFEAMLDELANDPADLHLA